MRDIFTEIAAELEARGAVAEAQRLQEITSEAMPASVVEVIRLLNAVQIEASKDANLVNMAARASLLSHQIQSHYRSMS